MQLGAEGEYVLFGGKWFSTHPALRTSRRISLGTARQNSGLVFMTAHHKTVRGGWAVESYDAIKISQS
jgi:hypothetical protein